MLLAVFICVHIDSARVAGLFFVRQSVRFKRDGLPVARKADAYEAIAFKGHAGAGMADYCAGADALSRSHGNVGQAEVFAAQAARVLDG